MDRIQLTEVTPRRTANRGLTYAVVGVLAIVIVAVVGAGALSLGQGPQDLPAGGGVGAPSATPAPPAASPTLAPLPASVTGTEICGGNPGTETTVGGVKQTRGITKRCVERMSDPRVSGESTRSYSTDVYADGSEYWWGTAELSNDGGAWRGIWTGTYKAGAEGVDIVAVWTGISGYDGLQYRLSVKVYASSINVTGTIEQIGPVELTGTSDCALRKSPTDGPSVEGFVETYRDGAFACTERASDPRVSGTGENRFNVNIRADRSADIWGTWVITNDLGTWEGSWAGTVDNGYTTHRAAGVLLGSGAYEGFRYRPSVVSSEGVDYAVTGTIEPID